jgi:hypothetical protein
VAKIYEDFILGGYDDWFLSRKAELELAKSKLSRLMHDGAGDV